MLLTDEVSNESLEPNLPFKTDLTTIYGELFQRNIIGLEDKEHFEWIDKFEKLKQHIGDRIDIHRS